MANSGESKNAGIELADAVKVCFDQVGTNYNSVKGLPGVRLVFNRFWGNNSSIPYEISKFVSQQYKDRHVGIDQIEVRPYPNLSANVDIQVSPVLPLNVLEEARPRFIFIPENETAFLSIVSISVGQNGSTFDLSAATMRDVARSRNAGAKIGDSGKPMDDEVITALAGLLPDPTLRKHWFTRKWDYKDGFDPNRHLYQPKREIFLEL